MTNRKINRKINIKKKLINKYISNMVQYLIKSNYRVDSYKEIVQNRKLYKNLRSDLNASPSLFKQLWYGHRNYTNDEMYTLCKHVFKVSINMLFPPQHFNKTAWLHYREAMNNDSKVDFEHFLHQIN